MGPVTLKNLFDQARSLVSEDGDNPEYDRALVELVTYASGFNSDSFPLVSAALGVVGGFHE